MSTESLLVQTNKSSSKNSLASEGTSALLDSSRKGTSLDRSESRDVDVMGALYNRSLL